MALRLCLTSLLCYLFLTLVYGQTCPNTTCKKIQSPLTLMISMLKKDISSALGGFPALIEVTLEELETGLEAGEFTSVDLVNVCLWICC